MSLLMLAQAADFVEYQKDCKARGEDPVDHNTFSKLCAANPDGLHNLFQQPIEPRKTQPTPTSHSSPEDSRERRRSSSGLGKESSLEHPGITREVHNKLEKNRRAHLKECFEILRKTLPNLDDRKTSNLSILRNAHRYIQTLKRKERDSEHELEQVNNYTVPDEEDDNETTTTASECGSLNDFDDNEEQNSAALNSSISSNFANSSSSSTASSVLVGPISSVSASLDFLSWKVEKMSRSVQKIRCDGL
ncbi:max-binding protein MNT [Caerostris extrusa]|uniref:Max-binding protein MNT n=1 Tax=Caerostris extrusa TaxID=172846 RepID=A0AAV4UZL4_CAEEX|nr:max-binding protein MNT [Caerostris extrusa]